MSRALPFTQAGLRRAIEAARKAGLRVTGIRTDGTLLVNDGDNPSPDIAALVPEAEVRAPSKWEDVEA
jgi:hypothetical protein